VTLGGETFPVALNGLLYFTSGTERYDATARWHNGTCAFAIDRPTSDDPVPDLGVVTCRAAGRGAGKP